LVKEIVDRQIKGRRPAVFLSIHRQQKKNAPAAQW